MASRKALSKPAAKVPAEEVILAIEKRREAVIKVIQSARERLLISLFRCTDFQIMDAIAEARQRNVEVRVLLTPRAKGWEKRLKELGAYLESMGARVLPYSDPVVKYHAKYLLADHGPALVGSLNLTDKCFNSTCDFILVTHDAGIVSGLEALFEADWLAPHSTFPEGITGRLIIGPDRARAQFTGLLSGAGKSIHLIDHKMNDPAIMALLKKKKARGVEVEVLKEDRLGGMLAHGKLIIVDGRTAAFGSITLSAMALDFRREVAVIVEDPKGVRKLKDLYGLLASGGQVLSGAKAAKDTEEEDE